jgi:hypothetical protein
MKELPYVETIAELMLPCDSESAFRIAGDLERFPEFFTGFGPIPKVVRCELITPLPVQVGSQRLISNGDGSVLEESVEIYEPGAEHRYRIEKGFVPPFGWLIRAAIGHWTFVGVGAETRVTWRYRFELRSVVAIPIAGLIVHVFFKRAMLRCLRNIKASV